MEINKDVLNVNMLICEYDDFFHKLFINKTIYFGDLKFRM